MFLSLSFSTIPCLVVTIPADTAAEHHIRLMSYTKPDHTSHAGLRWKTFIAFSVIKKFFWPFNFQIKVQPFFGSVLTGTDLGVEKFHHQYKEVNSYLTIYPQEIPSDGGSVTCCIPPPPPQNNYSLQGDQTTTPTAAAQQKAKYVHHPKNSHSSTWHSILKFPDRRSTKNKTDVVFAKSK